MFFPKWNFFPVEPKIVTTYILIYLMNFCENFWMIDDGFIEILSVYLINLLGFPYFPGLQGWWRVRYSWGIWGPCQSPASFAKQRCLRRCGLHSQQQRHYEFWCPRRPPTPQQQLRTPSNAVTASAAIPDGACDDGIAHLALLWGLRGRGLMRKMRKMFFFFFFFFFGSP